MTLGVRTQKECHADYLESDIYQSIAECVDSCLKTGYDFNAISHARLKIINSIDEHADWKVKE